MEQKLTIKVGRPDSTQAATIALSADNSKFKVPSTISFAAGEGTKSVDVTFDMETGTSEGVCIAVAPENAYQYGVDSLKLSITRDYTWVKFKDKGLFTNTVLGPENAPIVIAQAKEKPGLYKLYKPLTSLLGWICKRYLWECLSCSKKHCTRRQCDYHPLLTLRGL